MRGALSGVVSAFGHQFDYNTTGFPRGRGESSKQRLLRILALSLKYWIARPSAASAHKAGDDSGSAASATRWPGMTEYVGADAAYRLPLTCSSSASRPFSNSIGDGGQPLMCRSTGTVSDTPPTQA
ncbi:hypothetical protein ACVIU7_002997 [Bradyrhizobium liaoningense]